ncbi:hypothetical protein [Streptomyces arenae]|uniref:hypothetical protein n=1 Tax=Streptomyces arenae TaxID=29301 RepID=UPI00265996A1|nr:hypothetical protein [Streptomyces arenae]MCG7205458.1 hypothetical protein [Streptomyces arenae]
MAVPVLLLTGYVLPVSCRIGPLVTSTATAVLVVTVYAVPGLVRRLAFRRLLRGLPGA